MIHLAGRQRAWRDGSEARRGGARVGRGDRPCADHRRARASHLPRAQASVLPAHAGLTRRTCRRCGEGQAAVCVRRAGLDLRARALRGAHVRAGVGAGDARVGGGAAELLRSARDGGGERQAAVGVGLARLELRTRALRGTDRPARVLAIGPAATGDDACERDGKADKRRAIHGRLPCGGGEANPVAQDAK